MAIQKHELLNALQSRGIHYDLAAISAACERRGHPERRFKSIIVAGTNGKGSTSVMLYQMLRRLGFRAALYTSPHLVQVEERIQCDGMIPAAELDRLMALYEREGILSSLTYYEALTLAAFDWFAQQEVEWAVLEVGVGGRLDAVNLAPAEGAVIVTVDFDHRELLGDTLEAIAGEKAGVIKQGKPVVTGFLPPEARQTVDAVAAERRAPVFRAGEAFLVAPSGQGLSYDAKLVIPALGLAGAHQQSNAACALAALERIAGIDVSSCANELREALAEVQWPARFQALASQPLVVVDGAHNPAGARALAEAWREAFGRRLATLVFASFVEKDHNAMLAALRPIASQVWLTSAPGQARCLNPHDLTHDAALTGFPCEIVPPQELIDRMATALDSSAFLVTGSLAFAGWFWGESNARKT